MADDLVATPITAGGRIAIRVLEPTDLDPLVERDDGTGFTARRYATIKADEEQVILADYEVPSDRAVRYRLASTGQVVTTLLPSNGATWWKPLPYPQLAMKVQVVEALRESTSKSESIDLWPIGAQWPVTVHGVRRSFTGTVTVATLTGSEASRMLDGLRRSPVVLLQPPGGRAQSYYSVGDVRRLSPPNIASPERVWQLDVVHREAPVVEWSYPAAATWQDYVTNSRTWRHWLGGTWLDVLAGGV